jgi:signal recognition particle receptor subunit beta
MVFFNYALRKLNAKIVYYGPGLCGKTTNLQWIHDHFEGGQRGKMISLSTEGDRTIFFDLLPLDIGTIRGMDVTLQLYTVPGQVHYNSTRQLVLRGADGVVFVGDSQATMRQSNIDSLGNLKENLMLQGIELESFPHVIQFNKRDLSDLLTIEDMDRELNPFSAPFFEAVATEGVGVQETLEGTVKLVMRSLRERYEPAVAASVSEPPVPLLDDEAPAAAGMPSYPRQPPPVSPVTPPPVATIAAEPPPSTRPGSRPLSDVGPSPFQFASSPDEITTGVYAMGPNTGVPEDEANKTTVGRPGGFISRSMSKDDRPGQSALLDEPTSVRQRPLQESPLDTPIARPVEAAPSPPVANIPDFESWGDEATPFVDEPTDVDRRVGAFEGVADDDFAFGDDPAAAGAGAGPPDLDPFDDSEDGGTEVAPSGGDPAFSPIGPEDLRAAGFGSDPPAGATPSVTRAARASDVGSVDALMESVLGRKVPAVGRREAETRAAPGGSRADKPAKPVLPGPADAEPVVARLATPKPATQAHADSRAAVRLGPSDGPFVDEPSDRIPVTIGKGDPFAVAEPEVKPTAVPVLARAEQPGAGIVRLGDNQLHLRLQGTGAIAESGQVRALDIEVPVPGSWVGNRRVTLQLRLTLTPASEDEDGGPGSTS